MNRLPGLPIPHDRRFTLICDSDRCNISGRQLCPTQGLSRCEQLRLPDFVRIVFNPSRLGKVLPELFLSYCQDFTARPKDNRPRTGRTLIQSQNCLSHESRFLNCRMSRSQNPQHNAGSRDASAAQQT
jgi:hypothetical protein